MGKQTFHESLIVGKTDGPTLTAAAAASCLPTAEQGIPLPAYIWEIGKVMRISMFGRISCAVTTPGTARLDVRLGPTSNIIVFDSGALNLNIVAKTSVPWLFECDLVCRSVGAVTATTLFGMGRFQSEAVIASPLPSVGGNGSLLVPVGTPAVGTGFSNIIPNLLDVFFTQTVGTGSFTVHGYRIDLFN